MHVLLDEDEYSQVEGKLIVVFFRRHHVSVEETNFLLYELQS